MADLRLLGPVEVVAAGGPVTPGPARQQTVLAALLADAGRTVPTGTLVDRVWGDTPPPAARGGLYSYVTRLRAILATATTGGRPAPGLLYTPGGYCVDADRDRVDLHLFRSLVTRSRRSDTDDHERAAALDEAMALWRGEPLTGLGGSWVERMREELAAERVDAAVWWATVLMRLDRTATVIGPLRELSARHPLVEPLTAALIEALCREDRAAEALECYASTRERLADELGTEPGPRLRALHRAVLRGELEPAAAAAGVAVRAALLPPDLAAFVGRRRELARLDAVAGTDHPTAVPVVTVVGTAGVGKSALAVHWAHRVADRFDAGQLYVNLRGFDPCGPPLTPEEAVRTFLDALGVAPQRIPPLLTAQVGLYRSLLAGRRALVVLDNAVDEDQVRPLLPGAPGCLVVVTSRADLDGLVAAETAHRLELDVLTAATARQLLAGRLGAGRVAAEPGPVAGIVARCAGLPLALAVVAARAAARPHFPLATLAAQLDEGLDGFGLTDRSTDVRGVFSWSYRALRPPAARLFRLLGVHPGPDLTPAVAASLTGEPAALVRRSLAELVGSHLLTEPVPGRFTTHDLLRRYAAELVRDDPDGPAALRRVVEHYLHSAHPAALAQNIHREPITLEPPVAGVQPEPIGGDELDWFEAERPALVAAVRAAEENGLDRYTWQLAWTLGSFLDRGGHWHDLAQVQAAALTAARRLDDRPGQSLAHRLLGRALIRLDRLDEADAQYRSALRLSTELHDLAGQAHTHANLAWLRERQQCHRKALAHARRALDLYREADHRAGQASALNQVGWYHALLGDHAAALDYCGQAIALHQESGHQYGQASTWHSLGYAHHHLGAHTEAIACYERAVDLHGRLGDRYREADTLDQLAVSHAAAGDPDAADRAWRRALALFGDLAHPRAAEVRDRIRAARPG